MIPFRSIQELQAEADALRDTNEFLQECYSHCRELLVRAADELDEYYDYAVGIKKHPLAAEIREALGAEAKEAE